MDLKSGIFVCESDFGLFGRVKNEKLLNATKKEFDAIFYLGDFPKRFLKYTGKIKKRILIGINSQNPDCIVHINTKVRSNEHLVNFAKQTLEKTI